MAIVYKHSYEDVSVYGNVVALLQNAGLSHGVHVDIGCGYGAIADPIAQRLKLDYVGFDMAEDGLVDLRARGFAAEKIDLLQLVEAEQIIRKAVGERPVVSMTIIDTLEHLINGQEVLAMLRRIASGHGSLLVVSVPNVNHKDVALKALAGRWDVTESGLLDHTHVDFYNSERLALRTAASGWEQVDQRDWLLEISDQHFPPDLPLLDVSTPMGWLLRDLIEHANPDLLINQFVRAFRPAEPQATSLTVEPAAALETGLSAVVVVPDDESVSNASQTLASLARQSQTAFQVVVILGSRTKNAKARIRRSLSEIAQVDIDIVAISTETDAEALSAGAARAARSHIAFVPCGTVLSEGWAAGLLSAIVVNPLRVGWLHHGEVPPDQLSPFLQPDQSVAEFAVPCRALRDLGLMTGVAAAGGEVQVIITQAILTCGLERSASAERVLLHQPTSTSAASVPGAVLSYLNIRPLVIPPGSAVAIEQSLQALRRSQEELAASQAQLAAVEEGLRQARPYADLFALAPHLREFATPYWEALKDRPLSDDEESGRPFLSILTRTQGTRLGTLREMLLSLAGQSSTDFESVIVVHSSDEGVFARIAELVSEFPPSLSGRVRLHQCTRTGRAAPLNDGVTLARGQYVAVLDDDDFVFGHYVETFQDLHRASPGSLLRTACVRQLFEHVDQGDFSRSRAGSWFELEWPATYDAVTHLGGNYTPFMSIAFPRAVFQQLGMRFDETLTTVEDWELTSRAVALCGVRTSPEVTSVYRWWINAKSSLFEHAPSEWSSNRQRVIDEGSGRPILLPAGSRAAIVALAEHRDALEREVLYLRDQMGNLNSRADDLHSQIDTLTGAAAIAAARLHVGSTSWRITRPLRIVSARLRRQKDSGPMIENLPTDPEAARQMVLSIRSSVSWKITAPLRLMGRLVGRYGRGHGQSG